MQSPQALELGRYSLLSEQMSTLDQAVAVLDQSPQYEIT